MTQLFANLEKEFITNNTVPEEFYQKFDVKRGLRNADGSGVLAGLSRISSVIGQEKQGDAMVPVDGKLFYRGTRLTELVNTKFKPARMFEQAVFLLLVGRLATDKELTELCVFLSKNRHLSPQIVEHVIKAIPSKSVMNKLQTVVSALYTEDATADDVDAVSDFKRALRITAQLSVAAAYAYLAAYVPGAKFVEPTPEMSMAEAFLYVLHQGQNPSQLEIDTLDLCLVLHAEHGGGNNSAFTTYVVSSSGTDIYSAIAAAIASLKGPLHGGANKKVMDMMENVKANVENWSDTAEVKAYLAKIVNKDAFDNSGKIYGLGHAVYTKSDPRAVIIKSKASDLAKVKGRSDEYGLYLAIEALGPQVFSEVKGSDKIIAPNVDFFSGFVYDCLGIPPEVYTPMFAMSRVVGWSAHRIEGDLSGSRVIRPAYKGI
ncbi:MAG: citrate synthase [bacterium]|nr:citrate synthase [bacterium]